MLRYYAKVSTLSAEERATLKAQQDEQRKKELATSREAQRSIGSSRGSVTCCAHGTADARADVCRCMQMYADGFDN
jgi:hypothetical protein